MKRFDTFGEYMFDLLFAPLKKGKKAANQFHIFFKVVGREFDDAKAVLFQVRREANVMTCSPAMLPIHGQDRSMPRLPGESVDAYRKRLSMKGLISEWGGTRQGVLYALAALGYEHSYIEPVSIHDPEKWAEFIIFLGGKYPSGVNDIEIINAEVMKVKDGGSMPSYGIAERNVVEIREQSRVGLYDFPICGRWKCGQHPGRNNNAGYLLPSRPALYIAYHEGHGQYMLCGTTRAQEPPYTIGGIVGGHADKTAAELRLGYLEGCFPFALSGPGRLAQGTDNGRAGTSGIQTAQSFRSGLTTYPRSGQRRSGQKE